MSKQQDIPQSDNELIAEFMGVEIHSGKPTMTDSRVHYKFHTAVGERLYPMDEAMYDTSWDWIMPVVQKIAEMYDPDYEGGKYYHYNFAHNLLDLNLDEPIQRVYQEVVKSIKWYNQQTPKP